MSDDVVQRNLEGFEETMVHEAMHVLNALVEHSNAARPAGSAMTAPNLDRSSYARRQQPLLGAVTPFVNAITALPSVTAQDRRLGSSLASVTVQTFMSEALARVEAAIHVAQRSSRAFGG